MYGLFGTGDLNLSRPISTLLICIFVSLKYSHKFPVGFAFEMDSCAYFDISQTRVAKPF